MKYALIPFAAFILAMPQTLFGEVNIDVTPEQVVNQLPEGVETKTYLREGKLFRQWGADAIKTDPFSAKVSYIAEDSDGKVYIANAISEGTTGYLVGTRSDNKVTFSFPQVLQQGDSYLAVMRLEETQIDVEDWDGEIVKRPSYKVLEGNQEVTFTIEDGRYIQTPDTYFGFVQADGQWAGYGEYSQLYSPFDVQAVTAPQDGEDCDFALKYAPIDSRKYEGTIYRLLSGKKKGNEVFVQGLSNQYPESWIKGTLKGDRITFENGQFLGAGGYSIEFFCTGTDSPEFIPGYNDWEHHFTVTSALEMAYDPASGEISSLDSNDCIFINSSQSIYSGGEVFLNPALAPQPKEIDPTPIIPDFIKRVNEWSNGLDPFLTFIIRPINIYGQLLDKNNIGFEIEVEGKPYVFTAWDYWLDEDMTVIPWGFSGAFIWMETDGFTTVSFQEQFMRDVMIRTVYKVGDTLYYSEPQSPDDPVSKDPISGVRIVNNVDSSTISTQYYDLNGRPVTAPDNGIFIRRTIDENGKVSFSKIAL